MRRFCEIVEKSRIRTAPESETLRTAPVDEIIRTGGIVAVEAMNESEYYGYTIREDPATSRWEIFWRERKQEVDFAHKFEAEEWIDEQIPLNR